MSETVAWMESRSPVLTGFVSRRLGDDLAGVRVGLMPATSAGSLAAVLTGAGAEVAAVDPDYVIGRDVGGEAASNPSLVAGFRKPKASNQRSHAPVVGNQRTWSATRGVVEDGASWEGDTDFPVILAGTSVCSRWEDGRTRAQRVVQRLLRVTNRRLPGKRVVIVGYGSHERTLAGMIRAMGGRVTVIDPDPLVSLRAHADGLAVAESIAGADIVIGDWGQVAEHLPGLSPGAILVGFDPDQWPSGVGPGPREGLVVVGVGEGEVFVVTPPTEAPVEGDLHLSLLALGLHALVTTDLAPGVHDFPAELDREIATAFLGLSR